MKYSQDVETKVEEITSFSARNLSLKYLDLDYLFLKNMQQTTQTRYLNTTKQFSSQFSYNAKVNCFHRGDELLHCYCKLTSQYST